MASIRSAISHPRQRPRSASASTRRGLSYGATVGGTFGLSFAIVEGSVSGEAGTGTTINKGLITTGPPSSESSNDEPLLQTSLSVGRNQFTEIGGNIGVSIGANVQLGPVKLEGNWAKLSGGGSHRETLSDAYGLPAGALTDADKCVLSQLTLWNFLHFNPMLWKLKDLSLKEQCGKEAAEYHERTSRPRWLERRRSTARCSRSQARCGSCPATRRRTRSMRA